MKRIICLLLVILMVGALLVACGEKEPQVDPNTPTTPGNDEDEIPGGDDDVVEENWYDDVKFPKDTKLVLQLSNFDDKEFPCGCERYMEGPTGMVEGSEGYATVQNAVRTRNDNAMRKLGLEIEYTYIAEDWGRGIVKAITDAEAAGPGNTPDMYCDQMYDMAYLSFQRSTFSNLLKYTQENKAQVAGYEGGYFQFSGANGYNTKLMSDLALTEDKQFLLASDYFVDVMRAMMVMPFNLEMYAEVKKDDPEAAALYAMVNKGEWTWDALLTFSSVYTGGGKATSESERMLMALHVGGLTAAGLTYSTALQNYEYKNGVYTLKETDPQIVKIFENAALLAENNSIACSDEIKGQPEGVQKCKDIFTSGKSLFAGPQMLGAVEEDAFASMEKLSIVPIPKNSKSAKHNTTINSRARVGALSFNSPKKKYTSAWIQYSTEESDVVKKAYFDKAIGKVALAGVGASEMLDLIYKNLGSNKSMILDHMILHKDGDQQANCWSHMIQEGNYTAHKTDIGTVYASAVRAKQAVLNDIMEDWEKADALVVE